LKAVGKKYLDPFLRKTTRKGSRTSEERGRGVRDEIKKLPEKLFQQSARPCFRIFHIPPPTGDFSLDRQVLLKTVVILDRVRWG